MERAGRMPPFAVPQKVSIFKIGRIHFTGRTAATTVMPLLSMALYLGQFVSPLVVSPLAEWCFPDMPQINKDLEDSIFLFGARQTGKRTFLRMQFPDSIYIDLLDTELCAQFKRRPMYLYEMLRNKPEGTIVVIDEIPEVPELLNEVHRLISERGIVFVLSGSSARKLKRKEIREEALVRNLKGLRSFGEHCRITVRIL